MRDPAVIKNFDTKVLSALKTLTEATKPVNAKGQPLMNLSTFKTKLSAAVSAADKAPETKDILSKMAKLKKQAASLSKEYDDLVNQLGKAKADALSADSDLAAAAKKTGPQAKTLITQRKNEWINNPYGQAGDGRGGSESKYVNPFAKGNARLNEGVSSSYESNGVEAIVFNKVMDRSAIKTLVAEKLDKGYKVFYADELNTKNRVIVWGPNNYNAFKMWNEICDQFEWMDPQDLQVALPTIGKLFNTDLRA